MNLANTPRTAARFNVTDHYIRKKTITKSKANESFVTILRSVL